MDNKVLCTKCSAETNHEILHDEKDSYREEGWWETTKFQIIRCKGCDSISFRKLYTDLSLDQLADYEEGVDPWVIELFPRRDDHMLSIKQFANTPSNLIKIYRETIDAYNNNQNILCSVGLRAIIEGICNDKKIKGGDVEKVDGSGTKFSRNLDGKISGLHLLGYLTKGNSEILHDLRFLGNEAVHALAVPSEKELKLAIHIVEHTIENIYELTHKGAQLRKEKHKRKK